MRCVRQCSGGGVEDSSFPKRGFHLSQRESLCCTTLTRLNIDHITNTIINNKLHTSCFLTKLLSSIFFRQKDCTRILSRIFGRYLENWSKCNKTLSDLVLSIDIVKIIFGRTNT